MKPVAITALTLLLAGTAAAQPQSPFFQPIQPIRPPTVSPYLNMLRRDALPYQNYFGLVQPQLANQQSLQNLQQSLQGLQNTAQQIYAGTGSELTTGKVTGFFTHRAYFMTNAGMANPRTLAGQMGAPTNNSAFQQGSMQQPAQTHSPISPSSVMPFRR